ncbi:hypothetical protein WJR50_13340 [Catalinimonas sp. 4WD22]|uniref:hypothetical protein n=1 Tax=Catalinimonas locisalis TaxID=3133978 RepID=UPI0031010313
MKNRWMCCFLLLSVILLSACSEEETASGLTIENYLTFGTYYGECADNCVSIYSLRPDEKQLYIASEPQYPTYQVNDFPYGIHFVTVSEQQYALAKDLIRHIPENLFAETSLVIGEPDVMDQGGIYVETVHRNTMHKYYIDTNKDAIPKYLHAFVDEVLRTVTALREVED